MRRFATTLLTLGLFGLEVLGARAELLNSKPSEVCDSLRDEGLSTDGWKNKSGEQFGCSSPLKFLGSGGAVLQNNLTFFAEGTSNVVTLVRLLLIVNDRGTASLAHRELLHSISKLSVKVTGGELSQELKDAVKTGVNTSQRIRSSAVRIARRPSERGYAVTVIIE